MVTCISFDFDADMLAQRLTLKSILSIGIHEQGEKRLFAMLGRTFENLNQLDATSSESSLNEEVIICIEVIKGRLGTSVLDCNMKTLKLMNQDFFLNSNRCHTSWDNDLLLSRTTLETNMIIENLILRNTATKCLVSAKLEEVNFDHIASTCEKIGCDVEIQSNQSFKRKGELDLRHITYHKGATLLKDVLFSNNMATRVTASTVNCIINWVDQNLDDCDGPDKSFSINNDAVTPRSQEAKNLILHVEPLKVEDRVFLDEDSLYSLNIFPDARKSGRDNILKNGCFSVFELFDCGLSEMAKKLLKTWLFSPLSNKMLIKKRHEIIKILIDKPNSSVFDSLHDSIRGLPDILKILHQFRTGKATYSSWCAFAKFLTKAIQIHRLVSSLNYDQQSDNLLFKIKNCVGKKSLKTLLNKVEEVIDIEASKELKTIVIREGLNENLDEYRKIYSSMEKILGVVAIEADRVLNDLLQDPQESHNNIRQFANAVYIPQLGYLVTIDLAVEELLTDVRSLEWKEVFRTTTNIYYKNGDVMELDEEIGDVFALISDLEIEVMQAFQEQILPAQGVLIEFQNYSLELEVLIAFASVSQTRSYVEPDICESECVLQISKGRHPLYETLVETYIPNDIYLRGGEYLEDEPEVKNKFWFDQELHRVAIITGANQSGKSVYLTQNGLIVFLAHIGCFVPAEKARIGLVDKILTRIRTRETILKNESSFALDSQQMAKCLSLMTEKSLILVDEFGKGTDIIDGPSIFGSIIQTFARSPSCPRVLACTHFHELFNDDVLSTNIPGVKHYATEILLNDNYLTFSSDFSSGKENQGITFLFTIVEGVSKQSFGIYSAKICGVNSIIVERAQELSNLMTQGHDIVSYCASLTNEEIDRFQKNQGFVKEFLSWDLDLEFKTSDNELRDKLRCMLRYQAQSS